jgi:hypothetical protein
MENLLLTGDMRDFFGGDSMVLGPRARPIEQGLL